MGWMWCFIEAERAKAGLVVYKLLEKWIGGQGGSLGVLLLLSRSPPKRRFITGPFSTLSFIAQITLLQTNALSHLGSANLFSFLC